MDHFIAELVEKVLFDDAFLTVESCRSREDLSDCPGRRTSRRSGHLRKQGPLILANDRTNRLLGRDVTSLTSGEAVVPLAVEHTCSTPWSKWGDQLVRANPATPLKVQWRSRPGT